MPWMLDEQAEKKQSNDCWLLPKIKRQHLQRIVK